VVDAPLGAFLRFRPRCRSHSNAAPALHARLHLSGASCLHGRRQRRSRLLESHKLFDAVVPAEKICATLFLLLQFAPETSAMFAAWAFSFGVEFVKRQSHAQLFPNPITSRKNSHLCLEENVLTYPTQGCVDGLRGDHILLAPALHDFVRGIRADRSRAPVRFGKSVSTLIRCLDALFSSLSARSFFVENKIAMPLRSRNLYAFLLFLPRSCLRAFGSAERARIACFSDSRFSPPHAAAEHQLETRFNRNPSPEKAREWHRTFTAEPHPAASDRNNQLADFVAGRMAQARMEDVTLRRYDVLHSRPRSISLEMTEPVRFTASLHEEAYDADPDTKNPPSPAPTLGIPLQATSQPKSSTRTAAIPKITISFGKMASA